MRADIADKISNLRSNQTDATPYISNAQQIIFDKNLWKGTSGTTNAFMNDIALQLQRTEGQS